MPHHWYFNNLIEERPGVVGDAVMLVTEQDHCSPACGFEARQRYGIFREFDRDDHASGFSLFGHPPQLRMVHPVNVRSTPQRVAAVESLAIVPCIGNGHARARGVAGAEQGAEVRFEGDPKWRDDQVVRAVVRAIAALTSEISRRGLVTGGHRAVERILRCMSDGTLGGGAGPSTALGLLEWARHNTAES